MSARIIDEVVEAGYGISDGRKARGNQFQFMRAFFPELTPSTIWHLVDSVRALAKLESLQEVIPAIKDLKSVIQSFVDNSGSGREYIV